jgi:hypothetical protein
MAENEEDEYEKNEKKNKTILPFLFIFCAEDIHVFRDADHGDNNDYYVNHYNTFTLVFRR